MSAITWISPTCHIYFRNFPFISHLFQDKTCVLLLAWHVPMPVITVQEHGPVSAPAGSNSARMDRPVSVRITTSCDVFSNFEGFFLPLAWKVRKWHLKLLCLDHWRGFSTRNAHIIYYLLTKSDLKWWIHISRSHFDITTTRWVSLLVGQRAPEGTCSHNLQSTSFESFWEHQHFLC